MRDNDAADIAAANKVRVDIEAGRDEMVPDAMVGRLLAGESPVRVWREHRGMAANVLAERAGISAGYLSEIESGKKAGGVETLRRIAEALSLTIDDLI